jgi:acyl-CoA hydrolase/GNAT superfamily N-acetyltransferase
MKPLQQVDTDKLRSLYPEKFKQVERVFRQIHRGDRIFIGTACGEPHYLVQSLMDYVLSNPREILDAEIIQVSTQGDVPYTDEKFKKNFRHNSFFIGGNTRESVNTGNSDFTPTALSEVPELFRRKLIPIDVALIQTSLPDRLGNMSLGLSVDITRAAVESASMVIAQINGYMPRVHGETFINMKDVDFIIPYDEPLIEIEDNVSDEISQRVGKYVARILEDGDTIQVGYGSIPNAVLSNLRGKRHLGVHTELLTDGMIELMNEGVIDNSLKTLNKGKTVATFCTGKRETYEYLHDNPCIEFRPVDYTNNPLVIARHRSFTAINSCLQIDLTGQATSESIGRNFYSGIGGQTNFMRGAVLSPKGKTILVLQSTARGGEVSRIVPFIPTGAGITLGRSDVYYVVTEYGIAYIHGKNIRERAMELIAIAHPKFRHWLIEQAKDLNLIYKDQQFIPGEEGYYPDDLDTYRVTKTGLELFLRPVRISDEPLLKEFFYDLSDKSIYMRFMCDKKEMPHSKLQDQVVIDYTQQMGILAIQKNEGREEILGLGQYVVTRTSHMAEVAFAVKDNFQGQGIGKVLLSYLTFLAQRQGLLGFIAEVLMENRPMLHLFMESGFDIQKEASEGVYDLRMWFRGRQPKK